MLLYSTVDSINAMLRTIFFAHPKKTVDTRVSKRKGSSFGEFQSKIKNNFGGRILEVHGLINIK